MITQILYLGHDDEIISMFMDFIENRGVQAQLTPNDYRSGFLMEAVTNQTPQMVFFDFQDAAALVPDLIEEIIYLKRIPHLRNIIFVALFPDEATQQANKHIYSSGIQLSHIRGNDLAPVISDAFTLSIGEYTGKPKVPVAKDLSCAMEVGVCSSFVAVSPTHFIIDTDIVTKEKSLKVDFGILPNVGTLQFPVSHHSTASHNFPLTQSYHLGLDTLEEAKTWIDLNSSDSDLRRGHIRILSGNKNLAALLYQYQATLHTFLNFSGSLNVSAELIQLSTHKPGLIFFELGDDTSEFNLQNLQAMIQVILKYDDYRPFFVVSQTPSASAALQKVLGYPLIFANKGPVTADLFNTLAQSYVKRKLETLGPSESHSFSPTALHRHTHVYVNMEMISLSEQSLRFQCNFELPLFAVLLAEVPIPFHATVTRHCAPESQQEGVFCYEAIIHGLTDVQLTQLRLYVDQAMQNPSIQFNKDAGKQGDFV